MAQKLYKINLPEFSQFVYHVMATTPMEVRLKLTSQEIVYFANEASMKRFSDQETLEKKLLLLAKLEVPFCVVVGKRPQVDSVTDQLYNQYKYVQKRKALIEAMAREKVFVFSSNQVLMGLHMAAQNSHSKVYVLNYDYVRMNQKLLKTGLSSVNTDVNDAMAGFDFLSKAILLASLKLKYAQSMFGVSAFEMTILLCMLPYRNTFVNGNKIYEIMGEDVRKRGLIKVATAMEKEGFLRQFTGIDENRNRLKSFTIAEKGINTVMEFLKYIANTSHYGT